jgi:Zn-dependent peptidase ImmA (M78 family)
MYHATLTTLAGLRRLLPNRPVAYEEAIVIAECQANRLASISGQLAGSVEAHDLLKLTPITLEPVLPSDSDQQSGSSTYQHGRWIIRLNTTEPSSRQRFTLAHELKHIIDAANTRAYSRLSHQQIERICDHFAACLLMSKLTVYRLWGNGLRTPTALARAMRVSPAATIIRLRQLGLPVRSRTHARRPVVRAKRSTTREIGDAEIRASLSTPNESTSVATPSGATP